MHKLIESLMSRIRKSPGLLPLAHFFQSKINNNLGLFRKFDEKVRIYLTFKCNLKCDYCVNDFCPEEDYKDSYQILTGQEWVEIINRLNRDVILTGGEPFLHPDIHYIIQGIKPSLSVTIYTNFLWNVPKFLEEVDRPVIFYGSYHTGFAPLGQFLKNINMLRDAGRFDGVIHAVKSEKHKTDLKRALKVIRNNNWPVGLDDDQAQIFKCSSKQFRKRVRCRRKIILVAPNGVRYPCVSFMVRKTGGLEDLKKEGLKGEWVDVFCNDYGYCAPCDGLGVNKIKFLEYGRD